VHLALLSAKRRQTSLFSRSRHNLTIDSHSAANLKNIADGIIGPTIILFNSRTSDGLKGSKLGFTRLVWFHQFMWPNGTSATG
jgi:hypothetical protein